MPGSGRYMPSVSDLYGTDEIDVLLDEIRELEPPGPHDLQDFEIAGSRSGGILLDDPGTPGTAKSWDSHANYRHHTGSSPTGSIFSGVILYCDASQARSSAGLLRILLLVSCLACLICLCSSGTVHVGLFMLPLAGRLRLMLCVTIFSLLVTCLFLFLDISHIVYLFPFNWGKLNAVLYVSIGVLFVIASSLVVHMVHAEVFAWVPRWSKDQLLVTGILGYVCGLEGILISLVSKCHRVQYCPVDNATLPNGGAELMLEEGLLGSAQSHHSNTGNNATMHRNSNRPPAITQQRRAQPRTAPTPKPPSSSGSCPIVDDVQPCSSKSLIRNYEV